MSKKVTDSTDFAVGDFIKLNDKDGISIFVVNQINKSDRLGIQLVCLDYTSKAFLWYQARLMEQNAEAISILDLMIIFQDAQKDLKKMTERYQESERQLNRATGQNDDRGMS